MNNLPKCINQTGNLSDCIQESQPFGPDFIAQHFRWIDSLPINPKWSIIINVTSDEDRYTHRSPSKWKYHHEQVNKRDSRIRLRHTISDMTKQSTYNDQHGYECTSGEYQDFPTSKPIDNGWALKKIIIVAIDMDKLTVHKLTSKAINQHPSVRSNYLEYNQNYIPPVLMADGLAYKKTRSRCIRIVLTTKSHYLRN